MIVIAQCTSQKWRGEMQARHLYTKSNYFTAQKRYAKSKGDEWCILSAEYGILTPSERIQSYDTHITDQDDPEYYQQLCWQAKIIANRHDTAELIGGKDYVNVLQPILEYYGVSVSVPFNSRIGTRTQTLIDRAREYENESLGNYA